MWGAVGKLDSNYQYDLHKRKSRVRFFECTLFFYVRRGVGRYVDIMLRMSKDDISNPFAGTLRQGLETVSRELPNRCWQCSFLKGPPSIRSYMSRRLPGNAVGDVNRAKTLFK